MSRKIYSCSMFFNELDLLELKLETLDPVVDYFVISESTYTHSGKPKKLYFQENKSRFKKFEDKIIHQIITDTPSNFIKLKHKEPNNFWYNHIVDKINRQSHWNKGVESYGRDSWEKESLIRPIYCDHLDDIVLLSDLDEIVNPKTLLATLENFDTTKVYHFQHDMFYYYVNIQKTNEPWYGTLATTYKNFYNNSFCEMRTHKQGIFVDNSGWHFTYMGGRDKVKQKIESWGEQSLNTQKVKDALENNIKNCIETQRDLFFRPANFVVRNINDGTFPKYLVDHQKDIFKDYIYG